MRSLSSIFLIAAAFALPTVFTPIASHADPYRWCAQYGGGSQGGGTNCGFITLEQCRATISGMGGWCQPNPYYTGPDVEQPARRMRKRSPG